MITTEFCPLCAAPDAQLFHSDSRRDYFRCTRCALTFVPVSQYLSRTEELAVYQAHENSVDDPGYRRFLSRLSMPLCERLAPGCEGLDFGCGPGPALAAMLEECGHRVWLYDSFFHDEPAALQRGYDFVTATEVVEHLHRPGEVLAQLWALLRPGGWLGVMTKLAADREAFARWHYIRDPTHVCFFSPATWEYWAEQHGAALEFTGSDVMLLQCPR
jgi:2-polyprenyl-3-methyl-5-hydroxy-6-metoxy-1,4-benzoquinol methylase